LRKRYISKTFLPIFFRVALTSIIVQACSLICIFMIEKLFVKKMTFKQQLTQYAGILTPCIAFNLVIVLTGLGGSFGLAISLALLSLITTTLIYCAIYSYDKVIIYQCTLQKVYEANYLYMTNMVMVYNL